jgi:hypothetical protein
MYHPPRFPASSDSHSQNAVVARLVCSTGYRAEVVAQAIALLRTGAADLIELVLAGKITVVRALKIARQRRGQLR